MCLSSAATVAACGHYRRRVKNGRKGLSFFRAPPAGAQSITAVFCPPTPSQNSTLPARRRNRCSQGVRLSSLPSCRSCKTSSIAAVRRSCMSGAVSPANRGKRKNSFSNFERSRFTTRPHRPGHASLTSSLRMYSPLRMASRNSRS